MVGNIGLQLLMVASISGEVCSSVVDELYSSDEVGNVVWLMNKAHQNGRLIGFGC